MAYTYCFTYKCGADRLIFKFDNYKKLYFTIFDEDFEVVDIIKDNDHEAQIFIELPNSNNSKLLSFISDFGSNFTFIAIPGSEYENDCEYYIKPSIICSKM